MKRSLASSVLRYVIVAAAGFLLAYVLIAFFVFPDDGVATGVKVPVVVGMNYEDAVRRLAAIGLKGTLGESRVTSASPRSTVLAQHPAAGLDASRGTSIVLDVSTSERPTTVPTIAGMTQAGAAAELKRVGLNLGRVQEEAADDPRGTVLRLRPDAGQVVPMGTAIDLVVSGGPSELFMPDVIGREVGEATIMLEQLGVQMAPIEYDSASTLPRGSVISQSPAAGASLSQGTPVLLRVAGKP
ncbi:MAG: Serine/threonine-protein kinase PrkC [Gemmatimonadaceae bacterium]|nr:Serine/threonine-protein kinase PrkC [Gemmatimonadaceae bacterium]